MRKSSPLSPTTSATVASIDSQIPAAPSTAQTTATATTVTIPRAIENRNDVFITDQGSTWVSRRCALRTRFGVLLGVVVVLVAVDAPLVVAADEVSLRPSAVANRPPERLAPACWAAGSRCTGSEEAYALLMRCVSSS